MALLPNAPITFGDITNRAYELLRSSVQNLDSYTGVLASDGNFNARTQTVTGSKNAAKATLNITFTGKPAIVSTAVFKSDWDSFLNSNGFANKANQRITLKGLIHFLTCMATYVAARFAVVTSPTSGNKARAYVRNGLPAISAIQEMEPISASDIEGILSSMKKAFDSYSIAPCRVSWGSMTMACSSCSSSSCSSCSSSSCSSSSSSSSSSSCMFIGWYDLAI